MGGDRSTLRTLRASCLAVDFGGTLATPGPSPDGEVVTHVWTELFGHAPPAGYAAAFDAAQREAKQADRRHAHHTPFEAILRAAAHRVGASLPQPAALAAAIFDAIPDAAVDPRAAAALHRLRAQGVACVLACDTQRPELIRRRTLAQAGIDDCFDALVLSSTLGVCKPHPRFYAAVLGAAARPAVEVVFVGDTPRKDVLGPLAHGMQAVLIADDRRRPPEIPPTVSVLGHFEELPALLEGGDDAR